LPACKKARSMRPLKFLSASSQRAIIDPPRDASVPRWGASRSPMLSARVRWYGPELHRARNRRRGPSQDYEPPQPQPGSWIKGRQSSMANGGSVDWRSRSLQTCLAAARPDREAELGLQAPPAPAVIVLCPASRTTRPESACLPPLPSKWRRPEAHTTTTHGASLV
jgi:hypothetical protein